MYSHVLHCLARAEEELEETDTLRRRVEELERHPRDRNDINSVTRIWQAIPIEPAMRRNWRNVASNRLWVWLMLVAVALHHLTSYIIDESARINPVFLWWFFFGATNMRNDWQARRDVWEVGKKLSRRSIFCQRIVWESNGIYMESISEDNLGVNALCRLCIFNIAKKWMPSQLLWRFRSQPEWCCDVCFACFHNVFLALWHRLSKLQCQAQEKNMIEAKGLNMTQLFNYSYTIRMMILIATYWNYSSSHSHTMSWKYINDYRWLWWLWCLVGVDSADWIQTCATFVSRSLCGSQREQLRELELERDALREEKPTETMVDGDDGDGINWIMMIHNDQHIIYNYILFII